MLTNRPTGLERSALASPTRFARTLERQIEEILTQAGPRRQTDAASRGVVSVLFVTISGFAALCEGIEPPEVGSILNVYLSTVADIVGTFLGTLQNTMGDTIMATWNAGYPQADHALLAVTTALEIIARTDDINQRLRTGDLPEIACAIGINTGDAFIWPLGALRRENEVVGDAVNVAHLLSLLAPAAGILIAEGTQVSTGDQILTEPMEFGTLPGRMQPIRIFQVLGRAEPR